METQKCVKCRKDKPFGSFIGKYNKQTKYCSECREQLLGYHNKRKQGLNRTKVQIAHSQKFKIVLKELITNITIQNKHMELLELHSEETRQCSSCNVIREYSSFIDKGKAFTTCRQCRQRSYRSYIKHKEIRIVNCKQWKENKKEHVRLYNEAYRNGKDWEEVKQIHNIRTCVSKISPHRKLHEERDGVIGKNCSKCKEWKSLERFNKMTSHWDGLRTECMDCLQEYRKSIDTQKRNRNHNEYCKRRKAIDPNFKLACTLRTRILSALKSKSAKKASSTFELTGCTVEYLRNHLESLFTDGMTWENHGEWHIDHIRPCVSFDLTDPVQQHECFHYSNLQPLWAHENLSKGSSYTQE